MKHIFLVAIIFGLGILTRAQAEYEVSGVGANKILKGLISRDMLEKDSSFSWITAGRAGYVPAADEVSSLRSGRQSLEFLVFGGTWSEETKYMLPRFFSLVDAASLSREQVTIIGVDHANKTVRHLSETMHITCIPTIIVLKDGQEIGRVSGLRKNEPWDRRLTDIISSKF